MSQAKFAFIAAFIVLAGMSGRSYAATNTVVGTCLAGAHYTTIQAAVTAAAAGSTVQVCPGTYPEQIVINKNLTLKGVASGTADAVTITQPAGGAVANTLSGIFGSLAAQIWVWNANATISGIAIDGSNQPCPTSSTWVGILYQGGGGLLTNSVVANSPPSCLTAISVFGDAATNLKLNNNAVLNCSGVCFELDYSSNATIAGNSVTAMVPGQPIGVEIQSLNGPATVSNNTIANGNVGLVVASNAVTATGNNFLQCGVELFGATNSIIQNNHISGAGLALYISDTGTGGNNVTKNTVVGAVLGIHFAPSVGDVTAPNTFLDTATIHY